MIALAVGQVIEALALTAVTVTEAVAVVPAALVTVRVKVRAPIQLAVIEAEATPVAGQVTPLLMPPVPLAKVGVRVKVEP